MANKKEVSAQVVLKAADRSVSGENITSENVGRAMPAEDDVRKATKHFKELGFKVEHPFGNSFSISGPTALFEKVFKTKLSEEEKGGLKAKGASGAKSLELPLTGLPNEVEKIVETVTFSEPPDFGPGNF
jgi:hypothetical protein